MSIVNISSAVRDKRLTYLSQEKFDSLYACLEAVQADTVPGDFFEFGVALGGSGICLAHALGPNRRYLGFDVFSMIPPPSAIDGADVLERYKTIAAGQSVGIDGDQYYGYVDDLQSVVEGNFAAFGCEVDGERIALVKGLFADTLPRQEQATIAIGHIDCDWYEPVTFCLDYAWPRLAAGGYLILDDYNDWSGCRMATDEFLIRTDAVLIRAQPHAVIQKRQDTVAVS